MKFSTLEERICVDCGQPFPAYIKASNQIRCDNCQHEHRLANQRAYDHGRIRNRAKIEKTISPTGRANMVGFIPRPDDPQHEADCMAFVGKYFSFAEFRDQVKAGYMPSGLVVEIHGERRVVAGTELVAA